jgi:hypothetical protein
MIQLAPREATAVCAVPLPTTAWSLFLDVDGTLLELADHPGAVSVDPALKQLLAQLRSAASGAVALVSGRTLADLDRLFDDLRLRSRACTAANGGTREASCTWRRSRSTVRRSARRHPSGSSHATRASSSKTRAPVWRCISCGHASSSMSCAPKSRCWRRHWCRNSRCSTATP